MLRTELIAALDRVRNYIAQLEDSNLTDFEEDVIQSLSCLLEVPDCLEACLENLTYHTILFYYERPSARYSGVPWLVYPVHPEMVPAELMREGKLIGEIYRDDHSPIANLSYQEAVEALPQLLTTLGFTGCEVVNEMQSEVSL